MRSGLSWLPEYSVVCKENLDMLHGGEFVKSFGTLRGSEQVSFCALPIITNVCIKEEVKSIAHALFL